MCGETLVFKRNDCSLERERERERGLCVVSAPKTSLFPRSGGCEPWPLSKLKKPNTVGLLFAALTRETSGYFPVSGQALLRSEIFQWALNSPTPVVSSRLLLPLAGRPRLVLETDRDKLATWGNERTFFSLFYCWQSKRTECIYCPVHCLQK